MRDTLVIAETPVVETDLLPRSRLRRIASTRSATLSAPCRASFASDGAAVNWRVALDPCLFRSRYLPCLLARRLLGSREPRGRSMVVLTSGTPCQCTGAREWGCARTERAVSREP